MQSFPGSKFVLKPRFSVLPPLMLVLPLIVLAGGCASESEDAPQRSESRPGGIPHPPLDPMEPRVAEELEARRSELDALLERNDISKAERGNAIGRMGQVYHAHRLHDVAEACYREAHALEDALFDWPYYLGVLLSRRGDVEGAAASFESALEHRPRDLPALIRLADLELELGRIDASRAHYEQARSQNPSSAATEYGLGRVAAEQRHFEKAVEHFNKALALQPRALVIHYQLGQAYRQLGQLEQAQSHLSRSGKVKVAIQDPLMKQLTTLTRGASPHMAQGNTAVRQGRPKIAAAAYRRAVETDPKNPRARQSLGSILIRLGDFEGAVEQFTAAAELAPEDAQAQATLGNALAEQGQYEKAVEHLRRAVELEPALTDALLSLGRVLARLGRYDEAVSNYRRILETDPNHLPARSRLGTTLAQAGELDEGISHLRQVVQQNPEDAEARLNLGAALGQGGDYDAAIREHQKVLELEPQEETLALTNFYLGTWYERTNRLSRASEHYRRALELDPKLANAHFALAELLVRSRNLDQALTHYARTIELAPNHRAASVREAEVLMRLGRYTEAKDALEEAVTNSRSLSAAHALARLLAGSPDPSLRDGPRGLALAERLFESAKTPPQLETLAMALAEAGQFEEATRAQRAVLAEAEKLNRTADAERLARNLARYESGSTCCADPSDAFPLVLPNSPFAPGR